MTDCIHDRGPGEPCVQCAIDPRTTDAERIAAYRSLARQFYIITNELGRAFGAGKSTAPGMWCALAVIAEADDRELRMMDLADGTGMSRSGLSRMMTIAENSGWVTRTHARNSNGRIPDARGVLVTLTDAGAAALAEADRIAAAALYEAWPDE